MIYNITRNQGKKRQVTHTSSSKYLNFKKGFSDGIPICLGYLSVSFAFGVFSVSNGLIPIEALMISMFNVTSAGQLAAVPIIISGASLIELAATQLVINMRYALMSVTLSQKLDNSVSFLNKLLIAFVNTDEVFAVASSKSGSVDKFYMFGLILSPYLGWTSGTLFGALAGDILPSALTNALGFAIYGMFIAIVIPEMKLSQSMSVCVLIAVGLGCLFEFIPFLDGVPAGFVIIICAVAAAGIMAIAAPIHTEGELADTKHPDVQ